MHGLGESIDTAVELMALAGLGIALLVGLSVITVVAWFVLAWNRCPRCGEKHD
jgi:hypothetical protein